MKNILLFMVAALTAVGALAGETLAYQGVLNDTKSKPIANKSLTVTLRLYKEATGGTPLWAHGNIAIRTDANGLFNVELSDALGTSVDGVTATLANVVTATVKKGIILYMGVTVADSTGEIRPRQRVLSTPLAFAASDGLRATGDFTIMGTATICGEATITNKPPAFKQQVTFAKGATFAQKATFEKGLALTNGSDLATMPVGTIIIYWGDLKKLPAEWAVCDGQNGTPNFRSRYPVCAGGDYGLGTTGGESNHTLTISEMPRHTHKEPGNFLDQVGFGQGLETTYGNSFNDGYSNLRAYDVSSVGGGKSHDNDPPYRALNFIMKIK